MSYTNIMEFVAFLEKKGQLVRVKAPVSTNLEITEIHRRLLVNHGPAVLFENVIKADGKRSEIPVLINVFGTTERVAWAINRTPERMRELGEVMAFLRQPEPPKNLTDALGMLPIAKSVLSSTPKTVNQAPCQEVVFKGDDVDLSMLPIQTCWPGEAAPLITWPLVITKGPGEEREDNYNVGIYRMQVLGKNRTLMRWLKHRGGAQHYRRWKAAGGQDRMPLAVAIGADPTTIVAGVIPAPDTVSEYSLSGFMRGKKLELVDGVTIPIKVPAHAEIVLEGHIDLSEMADEGPYGDHTGYYNNVEKFPTFEISAITMKSNPVYMSTFTGRAPDEPSVLSEALNDVFTPILIQQFPEIKDFWLPPEACSYRIAVVSIKKAYPGQARRIMMGVWSFLRQFSYTKWVIVVDEDINVRDWKDVMWAISTRVDPARDTMIVENTPIDYLDFASPESGIGSKIGIDATNKMSPETSREWGKPLRMDEKTIEEVTRKWKEYGILMQGKA